MMCAKTMMMIQTTLLLPVSGSLVAQSISIQIQKPKQAIARGSRTARTSIDPPTPVETISRSEAMKLCGSPQPAPSESRREEEPGQEQQAAGHGGLCNPLTTCNAGSRQKVPGGTAIINRNGANPGWESRSRCDQERIEATGAGAGGGRPATGPGGGAGGK